MLGTIRGFWNDQRGIAMILVAIMLPVIIGFALLVIDMSRANSLHDDLQKGADAFALAGAAELDGRSDALTRADRAIGNLVQNTYRFSTQTGQRTLTATTAMTSSITWRYLSSIPANDSDPIVPASVTTDAAIARFVQVTVKPVQFAAIFPASFLTGSTGSNSMSIGSTAVAGNAGTTVCSMVPVFICNPFPGQDLNQIANSASLLKKSLKLVVGGSTWGPGNFGFLRPSDGHGYGESDLATDVAIGQVPECVNTRLIYTQTGNLTTKVTNAFNTRFDLYANGANSFPSKNDSRWPPAPNVRKGYKTTGGCNSTLQTDTTKFRALTPDLQFNGQIGNGLWDYSGYVTANNLTAGLAGFKDANGNAYSNANPPSRYDLYKYENDPSHNLVGTASKGGETGTPSCASTTGSANRRLFQAAIVDCSSQAVLNQLNGQSGAVPAMGFASLFLTQPIDNGAVMAEIVDINGTLGRGTLSSVVRTEVQLYR
ncbi:pilus assembly protein TadG-related protein [Mesorhizobium sp. CO1-1-7]|uniref:TadE/TadG family type IV pilus assembly protein n=1 Tax=Mesorhizobium sp. CO1-1-7 TaxID=2876632 RepID=UPI001CD06C6E|nr:pilus assembly protein TadG-related protein [Mesorhizobium sp. CO1-1-7]MBZ9746307.1 pilus assembly protein TadG-related protein [Mesorhizobium sp. CO1-1-7]